MRAAPLSIRIAACALALGLAHATATSAHATVEVPGHPGGRQAPPAAYSEARARFFAALEKREPGQHDPERFRIRHSLTTTDHGEPLELLQPTFGVPGWEPDLDIKHHREHAGAQIQMNGQVMRFDISLRRPTPDGLDLEKLALYPYLLAEALRLHPETQSIPARMSLMFSENASRLIGELFSDSRDFYHLRLETLQQLSIPARIALRKRILDRFARNRAVQARALNGFEHVAKVALDPRYGELVFDIRRGPPTPSDEVPLYFRVTGRAGAGHTLELTAGGELKTADPDVLELPGYPEGYRRDEPIPLPDDLGQ